jgi:undecaprenyl diphosphate synthase
VKSLNENRVRLKAIGDISQLPGNCQQNLADAIEATAANKGLTVVIALSYSGRWEITEAVKRIAEEVASGKLMPGEITERLVAAHLETAGIPDPELLIRTSGELRISNFLLWQIAYTEIYITQTLWPDFRKEDLYEAIVAYQKRERRFGKVLERTV